MNYSDMYYLKLNLTLLSLNIDDFHKNTNSIVSENKINQKNSNKNESNEVIIDNNFTTEKMTSLISKLNITTFTKSNSSLMCQIIYFLIMSYDATQFSDTLRLCYPVITLNDLKIFKEAVYNIMSSFLPPIILCGKSVLDEASGKKIEKFLRNFSDFVISSKISEQTNKKNIVYDQLLTYKGNRNNYNENNKNNVLLNIRKNCLITQISNLKESIVEKLKNINDIQNKWKNSAMFISKELEKENEKNKKLRNKYNTIINGNKSRFSEISSLDRAPKIENHSQFVKMVEGLHQKFIQDEEFKNNIDYINGKEINDIIDSLNSKIILNNNKTKIINNLIDDSNIDKSVITNVDMSKDKKELENLINQLKEKKENAISHREGELYVLHELVNTLDERIKEDNQKFNERNINKENQFESNTANLGIALDEQLEKIKSIENNLNKLKIDLNIK